MTATADTLPPPPPPPPPSRRLGPLMSMAMVVGTVIGSGIYVLPAVVAPFGLNILFAFLIAIVGTSCLALALARLARALPGGPYAYIAAAFGDRVAFVTLWSYIVSQWTAVAAVAIAAMGALGRIFPPIGSGWPLAAAACTAIAGMMAVNISGARSTGRALVASTLVKIVPLLLVAALVVMRLAAGPALSPLAPVPITPGAIVGACALMLFAFTGFEAAAVTANVTDEAKAVVPGATLRGTALVALLYLCSTVAVLWLIPGAGAASSQAPFADAIAPTLGDIAGDFVALIAAVSALGAGMGIMLLAVEVARAMANAGDLPPFFARTNAAGVATGSLSVAAGVAMLLVVASVSDSFVAVFTFVSLVSAVSALVLYLVCACAALRLRLEGTALTLVAILYALAMFVGAGLEATLWGGALALAGLPIRWWCRRQKSHAPTA